MENVIYKEFSLGAVLNIITGVNGLASWDEVKELLTYFNGGCFENYQVKNVCVDARSKLIFKNRGFINLNITDLNIKLNNNNNRDLALEEWLKEQEILFGERVLVSRKGDVQWMKKVDGNLIPEKETSYQLVKTTKKQVAAIY